MFLALSTFWSVVILFFVFVPLLLLWLTALVHLFMGHPAVVPRPIDEPSRGEHGLA
jgi:hypothetical protein